MVFHNTSLFRGHTLSQTFFCWHFLPAFVLICTFTLKLVLNFAFAVPDANTRAAALTTTASPPTLTPAPHTCK